MSFMVLVSIAWDTLQTSTGSAIQVDPRFGTHFSPIFESEEDARQHFPDAALVEVRMTPTSSA